MRRLVRGSMVAALGCVLAAVSGCGELAAPKLDNPLETSSLPIPTALHASVGDQQVRLAWDMPSESGVVGYRVFRRLDGETAFQVAADVDTRAYTDGALQNGRAYVYAVAARGGQQTVGRRSAPVTAAPNLFAIILAEGRAKTNTLQVTVGFSYPVGTAYMMLANDSGFTNASWETVRPTRTWYLTPDAGAKTVYAKFRDAQGTESQPASDGIELDTVAQILALGCSAPQPLAVGSVVHLRMDVGERDGQAAARFGTALAGIELRDDGSLGDRLPDDGVFERDLIVDAQMTVLGQPATGSYVDGAGNVAPEYISSDSLTIAFYPQSVALSSVDPAAGRAKLALQWLQSQDPTFAQYRLYRSPDAVVDTLDLLITSLANRATVQFTDTGLREGKTYYYRVFVRSTNGLESGGSVKGAAVSDLSPPIPVLRLPTNIGPTTVTLSWEQSPITDFLRYRLYRSNVPGVSERSGTLVYDGSLQDVNFYNDYGLANGSTYYYMLYVDDLGLKTNQSTEIAATTL